MSISQFVGRPGNSCPKYIFQLVETIEQNLLIRFKCSTAMQYCLYEWRTLVYVYMYTEALSSTMTQFSTAYLLVGVLASERRKFKLRNTQILARFAKFVPAIA